MPKTFPKPDLAKEWDESQVTRDDHGRFAGGGGGGEDLHTAPIDKSGDRFRVQESQPGMHTVYDMHQEPGYDRHEGNFMNQDQAQRWADHLNTLHEQGMIGTSYRAGLKGAEVDTSTAYFDIVTKSRDGDGHLRVYGKATDSSLDIDQQICDPAWLRRAMPEWFKWGNIREQHSSIAAGVATDYEYKEDGHYIEAKIVDTNSAKKVEEGVLKGFSVGIKNPRLAKDGAARGGRIVDGEIVEVSLVDRPANSNCKLVLAKAAVATEPVELLVEGDVEKRDFSKDERDEAASKGQAMPDGSFPIKTEEDLHNAIRLVGRAKDPDAAKAHIKERAKAMGLADSLPDDWKAVEGDLTKDGGEYDPECICNDILDKLRHITTKEMAEASLYGRSEDDSISALRDAAAAVQRFMATEADEWKTAEAGEEADEGGNAGLGGSEAVQGHIDTEAGALADASMKQQPNPGQRVAPVLTYAMVADLLKSASDEEREELGLGKLSKVQEQLEKALEANEKLAERLSKVESMAAPVGPARLRKGLEAAPQNAGLRAKADHYRKQAEIYKGQEVAAGYLTLAEQIEAQLSKEITNVQ